MTYGDLVHLMRVEAQRLSDENYHSAAILLHEGADAISSLAAGAKGKTTWTPVCTPAALGDVGDE